MIPSIPALNACLAASSCFADACQIACKNVAEVQHRHVICAILLTLWEERQGQQRPGSAARAATMIVKVFTHV